MDGDCTLSAVWGIIFKPWQDEPVYHKSADWQHHRQTRCGRPIGATTPMLPMKHCVRIGRPCRGCFEQ